MSVLSPAVSIVSSKQSLFVFIIHICPGLIGDQFSGRLGALNYPYYPGYPTYPGIGTSGRLGALGLGGLGIGGGYPLGLGGYGYGKYANEFQS